MFAQDVQVTGAEHIGINVPNAKEAVKFFRDTFGFVPLTELGPYKVGKEFRETYHLHPSANLPHVIMLRAADGPNLEIFEYDSTESAKEQPYMDDLGATHIAFYTDDIYASAAALRAKGIKLLTDPIVNTSGPTAGETWFYFMTPWGSSIELVSYPQGEAYEKEKGSVPLWRPRRLDAQPLNAALGAANLSHFQETVTRYLDIYNTADKAKRLAAMKAIYSEDCRTIDESFVLVGQPALNDFIGRLQLKYPQKRFHQIGNVDLKDGMARIRWRIGPEKGVRSIVGQNVVVIKDGIIVENIFLGAAI